MLAFPGIPSWRMRAATPVAALCVPPGWVTRADGVLASFDADFTTEGDTNHYYYNGAAYDSFAALLTALGGTFTGPAGRYRTNASGLLESVGSNVLRFDYDPSNLAAGPSLQLEGARTNNLQQSNSFSTAPWSVNATLTSGITGPDGTASAWKLSENGTALNLYRVYQLGLSVTSGSSYAPSLYAKAAERNWVQLYWIDGSITHWANFDLTSGVVGFTSGGSLNARIRQGGNGFWRISFGDASTTTSGSSNYQIIILDADTNSAAPNHAGVVGSGIYIANSQFELGASASSYIPTTTTSVTRTAEVLTWTDTAPTSETAYVEFDLNAASGIQVPWQHDDNTAANRNQLYVQNTTVTLTSVASGITQASPALGVIAANATIKMAGSFAANNFNGVVNGGSVGTDSSGTMPGGLVTHRLGKDHVSDALFGHIRKFAYWHDLAVSNSALQSLTA